MSLKSTQQKLEAIRAVATGFFAALDRFEDKRILELVTEDIEWVRPGGAVRGRAAVGAVLTQRARDRATRHLLSNVDVILADANSARVRYDVLVFDSGAGTPLVTPRMLAGPSVLLSGEDTFVLQAENWQIKRKQAEALFQFGF